MRSITLINETSQASVTIAEDNSNYVLQETDLGSVKADHKSTQYVDQIGSNFVSSIIGTRDISLTGWVVADTSDEMSACKRVLNTLINPLQWITLEYGDYLLKFKPTNSVIYSTDYEKNNAIMCKFIVQGECFDPLFKLIDSEIIVMEAKTPLPLFPLVSPIGVGFVFGVVAKTSIKSVDNIGDVQCGFITKLYSRKGPVTNPKIESLNSEEYILLNMTTELGDEIDISTETGNKYVKLVRNGEVTDLLNNLSIGSTFFPLYVGENSLKYSADANEVNLSVEISFTPRFLEVEESWT